MYRRYLPQRFNNGGRGMQLIRWSSPPQKSEKNKCTTNDYEYVYLLVQSSANYWHTDICPASVLGGSRASHEEIWSLLCSNMESAYLINIKTSYACTYSNTRPRHVEANTWLHFPFWINRLSGLCKQKKPPPTLVIVYTQDGTIEK